MQSAMGLLIAIRKINEKVDVEESRSFHGLLFQSPR